MKKGSVAAAVVVVLGAGYLGSTWFLGSMIEKVHAEADKKIAAVPYIKLVKHDYERSLFSADETVTLEIPAALFAPPSLPEKSQAPSEQSDDEDDDQDTAEKPAPVAPPAAAPLPPIRLTIKSHIQHGPLINFSTFAGGRADTTVEFEGDLQQTMSSIFGGKPVMSAQTLYNFQGGGQSTMSVLAFKKVVQAKKGGDKRELTISGDGMQATIDFTRSMAHYTFQATMPRFEMALPDNATIKMLNMHMEGDQQRIYEDNPLFYSGTQQLTLAEFAIDPGTGEGSDKLQKISVKNVKYDVQMPVSGDFIDLIMKMGANVVQVGEQDYGPAHYDLSLKHLHTRKAMALYQDLMALYAKPENMETPQQMAQAMAPMRGQFIELLQDNPQLSLDRISFRTPDGEAELNASIKLDNAKAEDFDNPLRLQPKIDFAANFTLPVKFLTTMAAKKSASDPFDDEDEAKARAQKLEQTINYLAKQGYANLDNGLFKSKITLKAGQLLVNDKPFNPMAMMMQMQMEEESMEDEGEEE